MKDKLNLSIEISESVLKTAIPNKIKRYDVVPKKVIKPVEVRKDTIFRYRPGVNPSIKGDFDV